MAEPIHAVLFDFSGTLMKIEPAESWVAAVLAEAGVEVSETDISSWATRLEAAGGLPGGPGPARVPDRLRAAWERRDLAREAHRAAYTGLIEHSGWPWPALAGALYERTTMPQAWAPYGDTVSTLSALAGMGVRTAMISNIGWDPQPVLAAYGITGLLDEVLLSYEEGRCKPDAALFTAACERLGVHPRHALMVGDNAVDDGGAAAVGIRTLLVEPLPVGQRPTGFAAILAEAARRQP